MSSIGFSELVGRYFWFLTDEYGFTKTESRYGSEPFSDGMIEFRSPTTIIIIRLNRGEIIEQIGPILEPEIGWLSIAKVAEFLTQGRDTSLVDVSKRMEYDFESWIGYRLSNYAIALRKYCDAFLRGDFARWFEIQKWFLKQMEDEYRSMTGLEFPQNQRYVLYIKQKEKEQR